MKIVNLKAFLHLRQYLSLDFLKLDLHREQVTKGNNLQMYANLCACITRDSKECYLIHLPKQYSRLDGVY